jgi:hypothetical protein
VSVVGTWRGFPGKELNGGGRRVALLIYGGIYHDRIFNTTQYDLKKIVLSLIVAGYLPRITTT